MRATLLLIALLFTTAPFTARAQANLPGLTQGVEYQYIEGGAPYRSLPPGMVEVVEVFAYTCPHCNHFAPMLEAWAKKLPSHARLVYVPGVFGRDDPYARAYFAEESTNTVPLLHRRLFAAIHETGELTHSTDTTQIAKFAAKVPGVNAAAFTAALNNDSVQLPKLRRAYEFAQQSGVDGTPSMIVNGRYLILGNSYDGLLANARKVIDALAPRRAAAPARPSTTIKPAPAAARHP